MDFAGSPGTGGPAKTFPDGIPAPKPCPAAMAKERPRAEPALWAQHLMESNFQRLQVSLCSWRCLQLPPHSRGTDKPGRMRGISITKVHFTQLIPWLPRPCCSKPFCSSNPSPPQMRSIHINLFLTWLHQQLCPFSKGEFVASSHTVRKDPTKSTLEATSDTCPNTACLSQALQTDPKMQHLLHGKMGSGYFSA